MQLPEIVPPDPKLAPRCGQYRSVTNMEFDASSLLRKTAKYSPIA